MNTTTVFAPATALGGAVAIIRISGDAVCAIADALCRGVPCRKPRQLCHTLICDGDAVLDDGMAVYFPSPHSYTGEDMLELHCHGGPQTVCDILSCLARYASPAAGGEFTKRAFLNGKMDLSRAEAVMDLVNASAEQSRRAALFQLEGGVSRRIAAVEETLLDALSAISVGMDFPDEAEEDVLCALPRQLDQAERDIRALLHGGKSGRVLRDGLRVAILGKPNVGKSSLLNALLGRERAIVTASAGTTRDVLCESMQLGGVPVQLLDTAGIRAASDEAEQIGVIRAREAMESADVLLVVADASAPLGGEDHALLAETLGRTRLVVGNKCDLPSVSSYAFDLLVSARTGTGLDALAGRILALCMEDPSDCTCLTNARHLAALSDALACVGSARAAQELDCAATDIRAALHHLGTITGREADAALIDRIFSNFCVGK